MIGPGADRVETCGRRPAPRSEMVPESVDLVFLMACQERVSDSTKEQRGRGRTRNNRQGDRQCKSLIKGCRERTRARRRVSSQEKVHTNKNLARAMAKSRAGCRQP